MREVLWHFRDAILTISSNTIHLTFYAVGLLISVVITRWIVRRKQSAWALREARENLRRERQAHAVDVERLSGEVNRYAGLAFSNVVTLVRDGKR